MMREEMAQQVRQLIDTLLNEQQRWCVYATFRI